MSQLCKNCSLPQTLKGTKRLGCCGGALMTFAIALLIVGGTVPQYVYDLVEKGLLDVLIIDSPQASGYKDYINSTKNPLTMELYVYDVVNPESILTGATPVVVEYGPYVYTQLMLKYNLSWANDGQILTYRNQEQWMFRPELSIEDDRSRIITSINVVYIGLRYNLGKSYIALIYELLLGYTPQQILFQKNTVRDSIWGYVDKALEAAHNVDATIDTRFPGYINNYTTQAAAEKAMRGNNTFTIWTGAGDSRPNIRRFIKWKNWDYMQACKQAQCPTQSPWIDIWATHEASKIVGTDGSAFPQYPDKGSTYPVWLGNVMRSIQTEYAGETDVKGISCYRYQVPMKAMASKKTVPENWVYYQDQYEGAFNISMFLNTAPMLATKPHCVGCSDDLRNQVRYSNLVPDQAFETFFEVEPLSGGTFYAEAHSQLNVQIGPLTEMPSAVSENLTTWFPNVKPSYVPLFWAKQYGGIGDDDAKKFVENVYTAVFIGDAAYYAGYVFGSIFFVASALMIGGAYYKYRKGDFHAPLRGATSPVSDRDGGGGLSGNGSDGGLHSDSYDGEIAATMPPNENSAIRLDRTPDRSNWNRGGADASSTSASSDSQHAGATTSESYQDSAGAPAPSDAI